jgi:hypothetical protein
MSSVAMGGCQSAQWTSMRAAPADASQKMQKLFVKLDVNGDGGIDGSELKSFVDAVAEKSGTQAADASELMTSLDADGNGSVSSTELSEGGKALFDGLRQQLMGANREQPPDISQMFSTPDNQGIDGANRPPRHDDGFGRLIEAVLAEYGSISSASATQGSSLDVAA